MAKFYGNSVKNGRVGGSVFRVRFGETIEAQYQPTVYNPNTEKQVAARAKFKLLSQIAEVMAPFIAIPRVGAVSSRNRFISVNTGAVSYANSQADVELTSLSLTKSTLALPAVRATAEGTTINVSLEGNVAINVDRVVYVAFQRDVNEKLFYAGSVTVSTPGTGNTFSGIVPIGAGVVNNYYVVYAYGVRDNTETANMIFGDLQTLSAETVAKLIVTRSLTESDVSLTTTRSVLVSPA